MAIKYPRQRDGIPQRPEMFADWVPRFPTTDANLAAAAKALADGYKEVYVQSSKISVDETSTKGARLVKMAKLARSKIDPLIERLDAAAANSQALTAQLEAKTAVAYNPPNRMYEACMRHQEIRGHFKKLSQTARFEVLDQARRSGDEDTLIALASCQNYLSGLPQQMHEHIRAELIAAHAPKEAAALTAIREQQKFATQLRDTVISSVGDLIDFERAEELIAAAQDELAS